MDTLNFNVEKIVSYLKKYKNNLKGSYKWDVKEEFLNEIEINLKNIDKDDHFNRDIELKRVLNCRLNDSCNRGDVELFNKLSLWIIKNWGGINFNDEDETIKLVREFIDRNKYSFNRIASTSKVAAFFNPSEYIIYDSRIAYSINWIILSQKAGNVFFPIPEGRNSKITAFDLTTLIRLFRIEKYKQIDLSNSKRFISEADKNVFIDKKIAYIELRNLVRNINYKLWEENEDKKNNLFYTEMLLFSIADNEIFKEIVNKVKLSYI